MSHLTRGSSEGTVGVLSPGGKKTKNMHMQKISLILFKIVLGCIDLLTYRSAVFGDDCKHHFCKLHRLCEPRTLAEELFSELCE